MKSSTGELTELEGAVLSEIRHRNAMTAFQVQRAFQVSSSLERGRGLSGDPAAGRGRSVQDTSDVTPAATGRTGD